MNIPLSPVLSLAMALPVILAAQGRGNLPDISSTFKGTLLLPVPVGNALFEDMTETIASVDGVVQFPISKGLGAGIGGRMAWFGINERALSTVLTEGDIRRATFYGKVQYEQYTGARTFYELSGRVGLSNYVFDCDGCQPEKEQVLHWGINTGYYIHATDNLAFGLTLGYERDGLRFDASQLGLESFPGRLDTQGTSNLQYLMIGLGFSTRFRRSEQEGPAW